MSYTFYYRTSVFNQDIGAWNVEAVTDMSARSTCASFNQDVGAWGVGAVTDMSGTFTMPRPSTRTLAPGRVGAVTTMSYTRFSICDMASFNQDIGAWNVGAVTRHVGACSFAYAFNWDLAPWNVSTTPPCDSCSSLPPSPGHRLRNANRDDDELPFADASSFNQDIGSWNVGP